MEVLGEYLGALSFILVGFLLCKNQLSQFTFHQIHRANYLLKKGKLGTSLWGTLISIASAGDIYTPPLITAGMISLREVSHKQGILIISWGRFAACGYVYLGTLFLPYWLNLILIGGTGLLYIFNRSQRLGPLLSSMFYLALILFGAYLLKKAGFALSSFTYSKSFALFLEEYPICLLFLGSIIAFTTRSLFVSLITGIGLCLGTFLTIDSIPFYLIGVYIGQTLCAIKHSRTYKDEYKLSIYFLAFYYSCITCFSTIFFLISAITPITLYSSLASFLDANPSLVLSHINILLHLCTTVLFTLFLTPTQYYLLKLKQKTMQTQIEGEFIPEDILIDTDLSLPLIYAKEFALIKELPKYLHILRNSTSLEQSKEHHTLHEHFLFHFSFIQQHFTELIQKCLNKQESQQHLIKAEQSTLISELEENLFDFTCLMDSFRNSLEDTTELKNKWINFVDAMDSILLIMIDTIEKPDDVNRDLLEKVTSHRESFLNDLRTEYIQNLEGKQRVLVVKIFNLFESNIWHIRRICKNFISY
jgi:Na+/phosphate symporter